MANTATENGQNTDYNNEYNTEKQGYVVDPNKFLLPEMGDYYLGAVDDVYLRKLNAILEGKEEGDKTSIEDAKKAAYYTESPPFEDLGNFNGINYIQTNINITNEDIDLGLIDVSTLRLNLNKINSDSNNQTITSLKNNLGISDKNDNTYTFYIKLLGLSDIHKAKWSLNSLKTSDLIIHTESLLDIKSNSNYIYDLSHQDSDMISFINISNKYHEIVTVNDSSVKICIDGGSIDYEKAVNAANRLKDLINKSNNQVYFIIDNVASKNIKIDSQSSYILADTKAISSIEKICPDKTNIKSIYFRAMDEPKRYLTGVAYIKIDKQWINLAKALLSDDNLKLEYNTEYNGTNPTIFNIEKYNPETAFYADAFFDMSKQLDDRRIIQQKIFGTDFNSLNEWTVTIGDVTLFVPPTNITVISSIDNTSVPLLRAKGSMSKTGQHSEKILNFSIYFNEDKGINGYTYKTKTPNGQEIYYKLNCLRALISEFKFCPFLPIENKYINQVLGIDAVVVTSLSINNIEGYPKTIKADFTCKEFNYLTYIPDIIDPFNQPDKYFNYFSSAINWPTMRYYYQQPLLNGDKLAYKKYEFNSDEFNSITMQNKTLLMPMGFSSSNIEFYLADKTYLDELQSMYLDASRMFVSSGTTFTEDDKNSLSQLLFIYNSIKKISESADFQQEINNLNNIEFKPAMSLDKGSRYPKIFEVDNMLDPSIGLTKKARVCLDKAIEQIKVDLNNINNEIGHNLIKTISYSYETQKINDSEYKAYYALNIKISNDLNNLGYVCANFLNIPLDRTLKNNILVIPISAMIKVENDDNNKPEYIVKKGSFKLDWDDADMQVLLFSPKYEELNIMSQSLNLTYKNTENIPFIKYDTGTVRIKNYSASLVNHISNIYLKDINGSAPQYLGGEDIVFSIVVETTSEDTVKALTQLPKLIATFSRKYKAIMPCYPLKVNSEITRFLGSFEMMIENVQTIASSDKSPVRTLIINMRAVDRTYRSREALKRIEVDNSGKLFSQDIMEKQVKSYFDIQKTLAKTELYPDLELPTIKEMETIGYQFIRYKFQDDRIYVDPDFYFIYPNKLSSQIIRETYINCGKASDSTSTSLVDSSGGQSIIKSSSKVGYKIESENNTVQEQKKIAKEINDTLYSQKAKQEKEKKENNLKNTAKYKPDIAKGEIYDNWTICDDIKSLFMESESKQQYDAFIQTTKANNKTPEEAINKENAYINANNNNNLNEDDTKTKNNNLTDSQEQIIENIEQVYTEGKNIYISLQTAREVSIAIDNYLKLNYINEEIFDEIKNYNSDNFKVQSTTGQVDFYTQIKKVIESVVDKFLSDDAIVNPILKPLNINITDEFKSIVKDIVYACACAQTGEKEYSDSSFATNWRPNESFIGVKVVNESQDNVGKDLAVDVEDGVNNAIEFGIFRIKMYNRNILAKIIKEDVYNPWETTNTVNTTHYLLDPYYRYNTIEVIEDYKKGCITNIKYATAAFMRLCLYWLKRLIDMQAIPSFRYDIQRQALETEAKSQKDYKELTQNIQNQIKNNTLYTNSTTNLASQYVSGQIALDESHIKFIKQGLVSIDAGKIWASAILVISDGSKDILERIDNRDYDGLNGYFQGISNPEYLIDNSDTISLGIRKAALALVGLGRIKDFNAIGIKQSNVSNNYKRNLLEKIYLDAADDPTIYIPHSCHDMIVHDARGRMLRAFPTFYMVLIDEGRTMGQWKLHDNFYNNMCIMDMQIVKSRKIAADTASITMSNFFKTFIVDNMDTLNIREADFDNVFNAIFSPIHTSYSVFKKEEKRRKNSPVSAATKLQPGARIHIRIGYGSNANMLPSVFNGVIAEVDVNDTVNIIAQGDGIELMNPMLDDDEAHEIRTKDDFIPGAMNNKDTPKNIMNNILTTHGGYLADTFKDGIGDSGWLAGLINSNPYGIVHFGDRDYKEVISSGEPTQNIFEAVSKPAWGNEDSITSQYATDDVPKITFEVLGKTVWDVANICRSASPDFICSVAPFEFRSTLFIGHPRYYYAYAYYKDGTTIMEKRKPFQQYHLYTSATDIVSNGIKVSAKDIKTAALGLYQIAETFNIKSQQRVGPIYADADIFPEFQKTMIVDTNLYGKGIPIVGAITNTLTNSLLDNFSSESHEAIAWRMTASALKESMKDMYSGDLILLGDPTVKPHDRMYLADNYTNIHGQCLVKEVVHNFSIAEGFTTTVSPDLIGVVDDPYEVSVQQIFSTSSMISSSIASIFSYTVMNLYAGKVSNLKDISKFIPKNVMEIIRKAGGEISKIKDTSFAARVAKTILSVGSKIKNFVSITGIAGSLFTGVAASSIVMPLLAISAMSIGFSIMGNYISNTLHRTLKNLQAMQIFPLKKNGIPFTAGVIGSQGFVYGSPTYNQQGGATAFLSKLLGEDINSNFLEIFKGFYTEDVLQNVVDSNLRNLKLVDENNNSTRNIKQFEDSMKSIITSQSDLPKDYRELQIIKLALSNSEQLAAYKKYALLSSNFKTDPKLANNILISDSAKIKSYLDERFLLILHETPALNKSKQVFTYTININGENKYIKSINSKSKDGQKTIYDIPFLNPNALNVLIEILNREKNKMPPANASDPTEHYEYTKNSFILLKSALRANDPDTLASTGFSFILEPYGNIVEFFESTLTEFKTELENEAKNNTTLNPSIFEFKKLENGNEYAFTVYMPSISKQKEN